VKAGNLREDLYYRISGVCLRLPPLRQRREDIPILMEHFLRKFGRDFQRTVPALSQDTRRLFQEYSWPGNVRELENAAKAIVALGDESVAMGGLRAMLSRPNAGVNGGQVSLKQAARAASREMEKELILRALTRTRWNRRRAAQDLQISYKALCTSSNKWMLGIPGVLVPKFIGERMKRVTKLACLVLLGFVAIGMRAQDDAGNAAPPAKPPAVPEVQRPLREFPPIT